MFHLLWFKNGAENIIKTAVLLKQTRLDQIRFEACYDKFDKFCRLGTREKSWKKNEDEKSVGDGSRFSSVSLSRIADLGQREHDKWTGNQNSYSSTSFRSDINSSKNMNKGDKKYVMGTARTKYKIVYTVVES